MRRLVPALVAVLLALMLPVTPVAAQDSAAVAVNRQDGKSVFKLSFSVKRVMDGDVDAANAAVAYASCSDCRTVAASIQVVLAMDEVDSVTTENVALAINYECSSCETLAAAYQYVYGEGQPVRFTPEGRQSLADIRRRLQELRGRDDLTIDDLATAIAALAEEAASVVATELVPTGREGAPGQELPVEASSTTVTTDGSGGSTTSTTADSGGASTTTSTTSSTTSSTSASSSTSTPSTTAAQATSTTSGTADAADEVPSSSPS